MAAKEFFWKNIIKMHKEIRCCYCKRRLAEDEKYCWFCELDISDYVLKKEQEHINHFFQIKNLKKIFNFQN